MLTILPAIDILDGEVVRLTEGAFDRKKVYFSDPVKVAKMFKDYGAEAIHMVNLSGAKTGGVDNVLKVLREVSELGVDVQIGGGVRSLADIEKLFSFGAKRVVVGTKVFTEDNFLEMALKHFGEDKIVVGMDIRGDYVKVSGWTTNARFLWKEAVAFLNSKGVSWLLCTDISKDGRLAGLNYDLYIELSKVFAGNLIASGGVSSESDIFELNRLIEEGKITVKAVIVGKAFYEKKLPLDICRRFHLKGGKNETL